MTSSIALRTRVAVWVWRCVAARVEALAVASAWVGELTVEVVTVSEEVAAARASARADL